MITIRLYKYGIDITNATLQTYAYELGIEKAVSEMTQAEKQQLRVIAILDQSRVAWSDQSRTINSLANQMRILENNMQEISLVLGQLFVPLMEKALPIVNGLTIAIKNLLVNLAGILGIEIDPNKFGQGFTEIEDSFEGITEGTEEAEKALEEYKNQLLGFDEVNKLQDVDAKATLDTEQTGGIDLTDEILQATEEYEKFWQQAYDEMDNLSDEWAKYFEQFTKPFEKIFEDIKLGDFFALGQDISKPINDIQLWVQDIIKGVDWAQAGKDFGDFFQGSVIESFNIFGESGTTITEIVKALADFISNAIDKVEWDDVVEGFIGGLTDFFKGLNVRDIMNSTTKVISSLIGAIFEAFKGVFENSFGLQGMLSEFLAQLLIGSFESAISLSANTFLSLGQTLADMIYPVDEDFKIEPTVTISPEVQNWIDKAEDLAQSYENIKTANQELLDGESATTSYLENIATKFLELSEKESLTADEQTLLNSYRREMIKGSAKFADILGNESLSFEEQRDAILDVIDALKLQSRTKALQEVLTNLDTQRYADLFALEDFDMERLESLKAQNEALQDQLTLAKQYRDTATSSEAKKMWQNEVNRIAEEKLIVMRDLGALESSYNDILSRLKETESQYEKYSLELENIASGNESLIDSNTNTANSFDAIGNGVETSVNAMLQGMGASGSYISRSIDLNINAPMRNIVDVARSSGANAGSQIGAKFATGLESSKKQATDSASRFKGSISGIVDSMKKTISDKFSIDSFSSLGTNVLKGIEKGVNNKAEQNKTTSSIATFASSIGSKFASILGIHSPSKVFEEFGEFTIEGFNIGLKDMFSDSYTLMENWGTNLKRNAETSLNGLTMATSGANFNTFATQEYSSSINVNNRDEIALLKQQNSLLQQLLQKETAVISPDADGLFRVVQNKANNYTQQTGQPAFII